LLFDKVALCQFGRAFHTRLEIFFAADMKELFLEAEKTRMTLNPIPGTTLQKIIVDFWARIRTVIVSLSISTRFIAHQPRSIQPLLGWRLTF